MISVVGISLECSARTVTRVRCSMRMPSGSHLLFPLQLIAIHFDVITVIARHFEIAAASDDARIGYKARESAKVSIQLPNNENVFNLLVITRRHMSFIHCR